MNIYNSIENIRQKIGVPYLDVICYKEHKEVFRYFSGENTTGKEQLYMYSCGKPITVISALKLIELDKLSLDDKVCEYLPEIQKSFIINKNGNKEYVGDKMTIRHLFTMTAGFTYDITTTPILQLVKESRNKAVLRDFIAKFVETPLSFMPGERFQYSLCHDVLAAVIEVVAKKKFSEYVKEVIFEPLQMKDSRFDNGERDMPDMYMAYENGEVAKIDEGKILIPTLVYESGGAGLVSTVEDYIRFADALACGGISANGYQVVKEETLQKLVSKQFKTISVNNGFTCVQGEDYGYGLGVRVREKITEWGLNKGEFGWDGAAGSYVMVDPEKKVSVFIGMHLRNWPIVFTGKHLQIVEKIYKEFQF
jgi:CubicO group peptidase (beta-lactamase class C family)